MKNITVTREGNIAIIRVDLSAAGEVSKSGKSMVVANSGGFAGIDGPGSFRLSLNVIGPKG